MQRLPERLAAPKGQVIYRAGDRGGCAYLILKGQVALDTGDAEGGRPIRSPGELVGGRGIVDASRRTTSAVALDDCELLVITSDLISDRLNDSDPLLRSCIMPLLAHFDELGREPGRPPERVAPVPMLPLWQAHAREAHESLFFEYELRGAIERNEFDLCFQPIVRLADGRLAGFEALVRWHHPERGVLLPNDFIPAAERNGLICDITMLCVSLVGRIFPTLQRAQQDNPAFTERLFVSINISGHDLMQESLASRIVSTLVDAGIEPEDVKLEVTESVVMKDAERCARTLQLCQDQGFAIAIDDFGTGYSSLHYLNSLPVSTLKIDRSFCGSLLNDAAGRKILDAIVQLGRSLGLSIVAEGVELDSQRRMLQEIGCDFGQGFLFGPPRGQADTIEVIRHWGQSRSWAAPGQPAAVAVQISDRAASSISHCRSATKLASRRASGRHMK